MRFRPCIDLRDGKVVQIVGGTIGSSEGPKENFVAGESKSKYDLKTAADFAKLYANDGLTGGHMILLPCDDRGANEKAAKDALNASPDQFQIGGGMNPENAKKWIDYGASHVIVTSYVFKDGDINLENLEEMVSAVGKDHLVLDLSCKSKNGSYFVVTDGWTKFTNYEVNTEHLEELSEYCDEFLIHAPRVEGLCSGVEIKLIEKLGESLYHMKKSHPTTYAGGVKSQKELDEIEFDGHDRLDVTIGSALSIFNGPLPYEDIVRWNKECIKEDESAKKEKPDFTI